MSGWIVISFYTSGTGYAQEIKKLETSLIKFKLPYKIYAYPPLGTWRKNLTYKSECILRAFDEFPDKDIVFIDADGIVRKHPALFDELSQKHDCDMACHFFRYSFSTEELLSGTLWFQNNDTGRALVKRWDEIGRAKPAVRHQMCLKLATGEPLLGRPVKVYHLPIEYTCIFDVPARRGKEAVIEHYQASRRLRRQVGYGENLIHIQPKRKPVPHRMLRTTDARLAR
jgi:hypothetical protein